MRRKAAGPQPHPRIVTAPRRRPSLFPLPFTSRHLHDPQHRLMLSRPFPVLAHRFERSHFYPKG